MLNTTFSHSDTCVCTDHSETLANGGNLALLDTLELHKKNIDSSTTATLRKRAKRKYISYGLAKKLMTLNSELHKSYSHTLSCGSTLKQENGKITSSYCGHRWCIVCSNIRTGKAINGYESQLEALRDPQFVTLTAVNVYDNPRDEVNRMQKVFANINDLMKKRGFRIKGLRKLEITHGANGFNPHYHIIMEGRIEAEMLLNEWMKRNDCNDRAQSIRKADRGAMLELLKYSTKLTAKATDICALDAIFVALQGKKTLQSFGGIKPVREEITDLEATIETDQETTEIYVWHDTDWFNVETGEGLTGYTPDELTKEIVSGYHAKHPIMTFTN